MRIQDAFQDVPVPPVRARQTDTLELGAEEVDGAAVQRVERVSARDGALFHERLLRGEQRRVELALWRGERAIYREGACYVCKEE